MNRVVSIVLSPESVLALMTLGVFWFCARHNSGVGRDVDLLEQLVMWLPVATVPLAFLTMLAPDTRSWWWLGRTVGFTFLALTICAGRIITGFGDGAKGQDAAFLMVMILGVLLVAIASSICGTIILAESRPALAEWFRRRWFAGSILVLLGALPIGLVFGVALAVFAGVAGGIWTAFKR